VKLFLFYRFSYVVDSHDEKLRAHSVSRHVRITLPDSACQSGRWIHARNRQEIDRGRLRRPHIPRNSSLAHPFWGKSIYSG